MISGVLVIFGMSFYNQTLLEISESVSDSVIALEEVSNRYQESLVNRESIKEYYNNRFLAKAKLIAYLIEEDPSILNKDSDRYYSYYDDEGIKHYVTDDEGNLLNSIVSDPKLQKLCDRITCRIDLTKREFLFRKIFKQMVILTGNHEQEEPQYQ